MVNEVTIESQESVRVGPYQVGKLESSLHETLTQGRAVAVAVHTGRCVSPKFRANMTVPSKVLFG